MFFQTRHHGTVPAAAGAAMEGIEQRFGVADSAVFASAGTLTSSGAVDSMHDSYSSLGGLMTVFNIQLGEVAPGGVGSGLYAFTSAANTKGSAFAGLSVNNSWYTTALGLTMLAGALTFLPALALGPLAEGIH